MLGDVKTAKSERKRARREPIIGPAIDKDVAHEAVGVKPSSLIPKEIPMIKKKNPVLQVYSYLIEFIVRWFFSFRILYIFFLTFSQIKIAPKVIHNDHKDDSLTKELEEQNKEDSDGKPFATPEEVERGKLPPEELLSLPMFKVSEFDISEL